MKYITQREKSNETCIQSINTNGDIGDGETL
jgi:hypothetical protein